MKSNIFPAIKFTLATLVLFCGVYPAIVWALARLTPDSGKGEIIEAAGKRYYANVGQQFTSDKYFNGRPSAVDYNSASSAGSNKAMSNPEYLAMVQTRVDSFLVHNPAVNKTEIPVELVTASGSGLDPDLSVKAALVQVKRVAKVRGLTEKQLRELVATHTQKPVLGFFGPEKVNVLSLNLALDKL
ncbi:MAG TPA: K(+)-transporting ATPase subunit C [Dyadobacter sp.]|jgi:K+-transporting ATPase ATPase C chain|nr:K(+)-transporting ATPase subunit C [Dyadobacter sp.]